MEIKNCKTCIHFKRGRWHKSVDVSESYQLGGKCELISKILGLSNGCIRISDEPLHVYESFGCVGHTEVT